MLKQQKTYYNPIFYTAMLFFIVYAFIMALYTNGVSLRSAFFFDQTDTFMDYFKSVRYSIGDPYEQAVSYPPLASAFYRLMLQFTPSYEASIYGGIDHLKEMYVVKSQQAFMLPFMIYNVLAILALGFLLYEMKKGHKPEKMLFAFLMFMSLPFLYQLERGNILVLALILTLLFFAFYDSQNKVLREVSLVCLALAVGIKLYPAIFVIVLLRDKRWRATLRLVLYSAAALILPFFLFNGVESIKLFLENLAYFSGNFAVNPAYKVDFASVFRFVVYHSPLPFNIAGHATEGLLTYLLVLLGIIGAFFLKKRWKLLVLLTCILVGLPNISYIYTNVFFVIPLLYFLNEERDNHIRNYIYLALMILVMIPKPFGISNNNILYEGHRSVSTLIDIACVFLLTMLSTVEGWLGLIFCVRGKRLQQTGGRV